MSADEASLIRLSSVMFEHRSLKDLAGSVDPESKRVQASSSQSFLLGTFEGLGASLRNLMMHSRPFPTLEGRKKENQD